MGCKFMKYHKSVETRTRNYKFSWESRSEHNASNFIVRNMNNQEVLRYPGSVNGQQFLIENCSNAEIYIFDTLDSVTVDDCKNCTLIFGAVKGSVYLRGCIETTCITYCGQFRTRDCRKCHFFLHSSTQPVIEASTGVLFGSNLLQYCDLPKHLSSAGLKSLTSSWSQVHDFTPLHTEPNWSIISEDKLKFKIKTRSKSTQNEMEKLGVTWSGKPPVAVVLESAVMEDSGIESDGKSCCRGKDDSRGLIERQLDRQINSGVNCFSIEHRIHGQAEHGKKRRITCDLQKSNTGATGGNLIPIQQLSIPGGNPAVQETTKPLVEWDSDESEEDVHFFPISKAHSKTELTDTFSVEEMDLSADEADLELLSTKRPIQSALCCPVLMRCSLL